MPLVGHCANNAGVPDAAQLDSLVRFFRGLVSVRRKRDWTLGARDCSTLPP